MTEQPGHIAITHTGTRFHFARHLAEMMVAMWIGMPLGRVLFAALYGSASSEAVRQHDVAWALLMAFSMTAPMVAVMLYRGHSRRSAGEMAAVMIAPVLPFVALELSHVITGPVAGPYMGVSMVAMIALMVYRRRDYQRAAAAHA
jgi:formate/nitrite transporter FocA (FNT family)